MTSRLRGILISISLFCLMCVLVTAQVTTADIVGRVTDQSGAVLPNSKISVENLNTHDIRSVQANSAGDFVFSLLPIGTYMVKIEAPGFRTYTVSSLQVASGDRARVDAQMEIGQATTTVEVEAQASALQTDSSTIGLVVTKPQDLPLNGRNYIGLAQIAPGTNAGASNALSSGTRPDDRRPSQTISVGAQGSQVNNFMVDGMDNNDRVIGTVVVRPSVDALAEVHVQTGLYTAEVGRTAGGVVNLVTKSGSNAVHGSLYEFFRNDAVDAKNFQFTPAPKPEYRLNQYGGSVGGPIRKDKTFFFFDYEKFSIRQGLPVQGISVPTALMKKGIFTEPGLSTIYDPQSLVAATDPVTGKTTFSRMPFQGNFIPAPRINKIAAQYMALYPDPTGPGVLNNYASANPKSQDSGTFDTRIDHRFSEKDSLYARYSFNDVTTFVPGDLGVVESGIFSGGGGNAFPGSAAQRAQGAQLNHVHVVRPNLLLEFKAGYERYANHTLPLNFGGNISSTFGIPGANHDAVSFGLTTAQPANYDSLGDAAFIPIIQIDNTFQYQGSLVWTKSAHTIKIGASLIRRQFLISQSTSPRGTWSFSTANTDNGAGSGGNSIASFLLGFPSAASLSENFTWPGMRSWEPSLYFQDDWRVTSRLTLNLGLRYDVFTPFTEVNNQISNLNLTTFKVDIAGQNGVSSSAGVSTYYKDFAPRVGFAYSAGRGFVLRGGFGLSFIPGQYMSQSYLKNPPFIASYNAVITNNVPISQMLSISQGFPAPIPVSPTSIYSPSTTAAFIATDDNLRPTYVEQFSMSVQKQILKSVVSLGYVGSLTRRNAQFPNIDGAPDNVPGVNVQPTRVYYGQLPGVTGITYVTDSGTLNYHSMQATFEHRYHNGLTVNANYTWAHALESDDAGQSYTTWNLQYGNSPLDIRHRAIVSGSYELPFGRNSTGVRRQALQGWQVNGIAGWQTGLPFTVTNLTSRTNVGSDRPNRVCDGSLSNPTLNEFFDITCFQPQPLGTIGSSGPDILYGPHFKHVDMSIFKNFRITEGIRLQLRAEGYNISNTPSFGNPNAAIPGSAGGNPALGRISTLAGGYVPRQLQFALKLLF